MLWLRRGLSAHLFVHAVISGAAAVTPVALLFGASDSVLGGLRWALIVSLVLYIASALLLGRGAPRGREPEYARAVWLLEKGPYAARHKFALVLGLIVPLALILAGNDSPAALSFASALALAGLWLDGDLFIKAGQALRIS